MKRLTSFCMGRCLFLLLLIPILSGASYFGYVHESGNFFSVVDGQAYRSGQLDPMQLAHYIKTYNIRSILNLRGTSAGSLWYEEERNVAAQHGVTHYDFGISANRDLDDADIESILGIIRDAPKPILIHCKSGSDRAGLVAAIYRYSLGGITADEAADELSIFFGHFPMWNSTEAMDRTFWRYATDHPSPPHF